jgi:transcriptional regulator with XRE-family HTH domain
MEMKIDASLLRAEREKKAWSQDHLARASGLGLRTIQRIETSGSASFESALAIASSLEIDVDRLRADSRQTPIVTQTASAIRSLFSLRATEFLDLYRFRGEIGRLPFIICVVFFFALALISQNLIMRGLLNTGRSPAEFEYTLLFVHWAPYLLTLPLCASRLRAIGWPPIMSLVVLVPPITMRLVFLGSTVGSVWRSNTVIVSLIILLGFLLALSRWPAKCDEPSSSH